MARSRTLKVLVLGGTGMLGSMMVRHLSEAGDVRLRATFRGGAEGRQTRSAPNLEWIQFDAERDRVKSVIAGEDWIVNAIGIIKPLIREDVLSDVERAIKVNALFPYSLAEAAAGNNARVIQIATDCVYSGRRGQYTEQSEHDALDVYGKTKSLGEVVAPHFLNLRCSIIGPEQHGHRSLLDWFLRQPRGASVRGYINHRWNGVTTLHFAQLVLGLMRSGSAISGSHHVVPSDSVTKAELLREFAVAFQRRDIQIEDSEAPQPIDRTLATLTPDLNQELWRGAGRTNIPRVRSMLEELSPLLDNVTR